MSEPLDRAFELYEQCEARADEGDFPGAETLCRQALAIFEREEPRSANVANVLHSLGVILERQAKFYGAAECAEQAVQILEATDDDAKLLLAQTYGIWGNALRMMNQFDEARDRFRKAVEIAETLQDHPIELAGALNNLGVLDAFAGDPDRAQQAYGRALDIARSSQGEHHDMVAAVSRNLARLMLDQQRYAEAEEPARRAWQIRRESMGDEHPATLADAGVYAAVLDALGRHRESKAIYERLLAAYKQNSGAESYEYAATLHNLAVAEQGSGQVERAIDACRRSLAIKEKVLGAEHPDTALSEMNLGAMLLEHGDREEAGIALRNALTLLERTLPADHPHLQLCRDLLNNASRERIDHF